MPLELSRGPVRAALFDLDNTLLDRDAGFVRWVSQRAAPGDIPRLVALDRGGHGPRPALFQAIAALTGEAPAEVHRAFYAEIGGCCPLRPDADALLRRLTGVVPTAIVTNGPARSQRHKLRTAGLLDRVDAVVVSGELGVDKPAPAPFLAALAALGVGTEGAWMVGDHPVCDIAGGRAVGLSTVFVRSAWFEDCAADRVVDALTEWTWP